MTILNHITLDALVRLIECVVTGYCDCLRELASTDKNRLDAMKEGVPF